MPLGSAIIAHPAKGQRWQRRRAAVKRFNVHTPRHNFVVYQQAMQRRAGLPRWRHHLSCTRATGGHCLSYHHAGFEIRIIPTGGSPGVARPRRVCRTVVVVGHRWDAASATLKRRKVAERPQTMRALLQLLQPLRMLLFHHRLWFGMASRHVCNPLKPVC